MQLQYKHLVELCLSLFIPVCSGFVPSLCSVILPHDRSEDSLSAMDSLQYKVLEFDMPGDDFDPNFTPEDGLQYLQQVVYERQRCPAVVVKPLPVGALAALPAIPTPSWSGLKPVCDCDIERDLKRAVININSK